MNIGSGECDCHFVGLALSSKRRRQRLTMSTVGNTKPSATYMRQQYPSQPHLSHVSLTAGLLIMCKKLVEFFHECKQADKHLLCAPNNMVWCDGAKSAGTSCELSDGVDLENDVLWPVAGSCPWCRGGGYPTDLLLMPAAVQGARRKSITTNWVRERQQWEDGERQEVRTMPRTDGMVVFTDGVLKIGDRKRGPENADEKGSAKRQRPEDEEGAEEEKVEDDGNEEREMQAEDAK